MRNPVVCLQLQYVSALPHRCVKPICFHDDVLFPGNRSSSPSYPFTGMRDSCRHSRAVCGNVLHEMERLIVRQNLLARDRPRKPRLSLRYMRTDSGLRRSPSVHSSDAHHWNLQIYICSREIKANTHFLEGCLAFLGSMRNNDNCGCVAINLCKWFSSAKEHRLRLFRAEQRRGGCRWQSWLPLHYEAQDKIGTISGCWRPRRLGSVRTG